MASVSYGPRKEIRARVAALLVHSDRIMAVQHTTPDDRWWCFPGGGQEAGEDQRQTIVREVKEELNLRVVPMRLLYIAEFMMHGDQSVEFYWLCGCRDDRFDIPKKEQSVTDASWINLDRLQNHDILPAFVKNRVAQDWRGFPTYAEYLGAHGPNAR